MLKIYAIIAAALTLILDVPFDIFKASYSWWLVPLVYVGCILLLIVLHHVVLAISIATVKLDKPPRDTDFFRFLINGFLRVAAPLLGVKIHIKGTEKIPDDEPFLLVCNHIHDLDPAVIYYAVPNARLSFIAKRELREIYPFVYKALHKLNGLPIDRENNREAAKTIISATKLIKEKTNSVAIFPEGYVSLSGKLLPIRNGALKIATKSQAKIVVCTLWGTKQVPKNLFKRRTHVDFEVLEVLDTTDKQTVELGEQISKIMLDSLKHKKDYPQDDLNEE